MNCWNIPGWGAAQAQIREAVHFLCDGKDRNQRIEIVQEIVEAIRSIAWGDKPPQQMHPLHDGHEAHFRELWARMVANNLARLRLRPTRHVDIVAPIGG